MEAETMRDLEAMIRLTGPEWQENMRKRAVEKEVAAMPKWRAKMKRHNGGVGSRFYVPYSDELTFAEDIRLRCTVADAAERGTAEQRGGDERRA